MSNEIPVEKPERKETMDDNDRKFITQPIDPQLLAEANSFTLVVDWLETDKAREKKLARKTFEDGSVQILLIAKVTIDGKRKTVKEPLSEERYHEYLDGRSKSAPHLEKKRYEFAYTQDGAEFGMKYDVFAGGGLHMLEVGASSDEERASFAPEHFPAAMREVTGNLDYYGYRVCEVLSH